jgi:DNA-binding MarR family transcriptional regulator
MRMALAPGADRDYVDQLLQQWRRERPDLDPSPMGIIARISRAAHLLEKAQEEVFSSFGLHRGRFDVLAALRRAGPPFCLSPTALYNSLLISSGAMTHRLDRLTHAGLIERVPAPTDGRSLLVRLTDKGLAIVDAAISAHLTNEQKLVASLSEEEREFLGKALRQLLLAHGDHPHAIDSVHHATDTAGR